MTSRDPQWYLSAGLSCHSIYGVQAVEIILVSVCVAMTMCIIAFNIASSRCAI